jgi:hypothetical protein
MDNFKTKILSFLFGRHRLCVVKDTDGFLSRKDVQEWLLDANVVFGQGSQFQLRLMFELKYKTDTDCKYCFIAEDNFQILPDIRQCSNFVTLNLSDFFPAYHKPTVASASLDVIQKLYDRVQVKTLNKTETKTIIAQLEEQRDPMDAILKKLSWIAGDDLEEKLVELNECIVESLEKDGFGKIEKEIDRINSEWQKGIEERYFGKIPSSFLSAPSYVGNVLNHIQANYKNDKVALVVVDGMSFWQYLTLKKSLPGSLKIQDSHIYSWIPSITMLSRQAIFRGGVPIRDYKQNPQNEEKLWFDYWKGHGFRDDEIGYEFNVLGESCGTSKRLAYVTVKLDEKMHASENYRDLYSLTKNWASSFVNDIERLINNGYKVFLTTDHGNVEAKGWRRLTPQEKVYLYGDESRGKRHLIYDDANGMDELYNQMDHDNVWRYEDWIVWRNRESFSSKGCQEITHGGCHFLEVLVPFIKIV